MSGALAGTTVAVAGLGPMGRGIARVFHAAGARVLVCDVSAEATQQGVDRIHTEAEQEAAPVDVASALLPEAAAQADLFIEAIVEDMAAKTRLLTDVREHGRADLIVASNTSSLSIGQMGAAFGDPARVIGLHFFNPPTKMRLVEVILGTATSPKVHERALEVVAALGKTAVTCADSPNFVVNRICRPLYYEAQLLVMQGLEAAVVDVAARGALGHRMGPLELLDFTGLHTHLASSETAHREFGDPRYRPIPQVRRLVRNGMTGRAVGRGFYHHSEESTREARARVTRSPGPPPAQGAVTVTGPDADELRAHPVVAPRLAEDAPVLVYSCHRPPRKEDLAAVRTAQQRTTVVVDTSDDGWGPWLPEGSGWVRLHALRGDVFAEVVEDDEAGITPPPAVTDLLDLLQAPSVRVLALPGLVADRLASCLANEAYSVVEEGTATPADVNTALRLAMNHPVGPLEYAEQVGVGKVHTALRSMLDAFGDPRYRPAPLLRRQHARGLRERPDQPEGQELQGTGTR